MPILEAVTNPPHVRSPCECVPSTMSSLSPDWRDVRGVVPVILTWAGRWVAANRCDGSYVTGRRS